MKTRYIDSIRIINESGLYSLILSSKLESAKRFKRWITSEVLPSIRKTGEYKTSSGGKGILVPDFSNPADAARAWADQYEAAQRAIAEKSQAEAEKQQALKTIEEHKPDVEFAESFRKVDHNNMWLIRDIAKKKVFKCENELVKATLMYLDDPDAPEGVAFIRWLAVQDYLGEKINWKDLT